MLYLSNSNAQPNIFVTSYDNVSVDLVYNEKIKHIDTEGLSKILDHIEDIHFINYTNIEDNIPDKIIVDLYGRKVVFKPETCILRVYNQRFAHVVCGFVYQSEYFLYDSDGNNYFKADWRNLTQANLKDIIEFYNVYDMFTDKYEYNIFDKIFIYENVMYYNTETDFSYDTTQCTPSRPGNPGNPALST